MNKQQCRGGSRPAPTAITLLLFLCLTAHATTAVKVFSRDESMSASNQSTPRIYLQNTGTETINDLTYRYYFTTENNLTPALEDYYTPNDQIMLVPTGSGYYIQYSVSAANLLPGGLLPHSSGNSVGLHYNDWSAWSKTNDFSNNQSASFAENQNISVYVNGTKIYGSEPSSTSGSVLREVWTNVTGTSVDNIPVTTTPQSSGSQSTLDAPRNTGDNYGARIRGYITAPATGSYTFWIAADDAAQLWLATNDQPSTKTLMASVTAYTAVSEWNKYSSQKSAAVTLTAGARYYVEILHKEGTQNDLCMVGWLKPGQSGSVPSEIVPSSVLTPFVPAVLPAAPVNLTATAVSSQRIDIAWSDVANNEYGFRIERAGASGPFSEIAVVAANQTSYQITGLTPETTYKFKVRAYNATGNSDYTSVAQTSTFAVPAGTVTREIWTGVTGTSVSNIPTSAAANIVNTLTTLETAVQWADYYGERIRGYVIPPSTGSYTFWIASDDNAQLWLSGSDQPSTKTLVASVTGYNNYREWNKYSSQKSSAVTLTAGARYYIEILHKENNQNDNLSVGWLRPGQSGSVPSEIVPATALSPFIIPSLPNAPANLVATAISASQVDLAWSDLSNNESGFRIERALGAGAFVEVGVAAANATIYHDAGLAANTQYKYRIRSYNDLGNSTAYSNTPTVITLSPQQSSPPPQNLLSFALYSQEKSTLKDRCVFNGGGAVGSNTAVELYSQSIVNGNVVSGGTILLKSQADVNGSAIAAGTVTLEAGATADAVQENATVAIVTIPEKTAITTGTETVDVASGVNRTLLPGYYSSAVVQSNGTLTLKPGYYSFTTLFLQPDAKIELDVQTADMVEVDVASELEFSDRSKVLFKNAGQGYVPFVRFYTNDANTVRIGCEVQLNGTLTAPRGAIAMYSRAQCNGALYGKTISIEPDAVIMSNMTNPELDSDGDGIANILEALLGTKMDDPTSYIPIAIPSEGYIDNTKDVIITYDYSRYFPDYAFAKTMQVTFPAGSLEKPFIPLIVVAGNEPLGGGQFTMPGYEILGRYINVLPVNGLTTNASFTMQTPRQQVLAGAEYTPWQKTTTVWNPMLPENIITSDNNSVTIRYTSTQPVVFAGVKKTGSRTLYFDGGYVFTNTGKSMLRFDLGIYRYEAPLDSVKIKINYLDYSTNPQGSSRVYEERCDQIDGLYQVRTVYHKKKPLFCPGAMGITAAQILFFKTDGTMVASSYVPENTIRVNQGQVFIMSARGMAEWFLANPDKKIALYFNPCTETFESAAFSDGRILYDGSGSSDIYTYQYYITDHLGSTRMVVDDQGTPVEAVNYMPYGSMQPVDIALNPDIAVREKFTGKEFDREGAGYGVTEIAIALDFPVPASNEATPNRMEVYYSNAPDDVSKADVVPVQLYGSAGYGRFTASLTNMESRTISKVRFFFENDTRSCTVADINEVASVDAKVTISRTFTAVSEFTGVKQKTFLTYQRTAGENGFYLAGLGQYYFGARYYDPEVGGWLSCDKAGQFWSGYGYGGNGTNPIIMVDADGNFLDPFTWAIIIGAIAGAYQGYKSGESQGYKGAALVAFTLYGAGAGAIAGTFGGAIAGANFIGSGTLGLAASSTINSLGTAAMTNGKSGVLSNFGFGSMNWSKMEFKLNNPFDKDPLLQNISDGMGWLTNFQDVHYARNQLNDLPSADEILSEEEWKLLKHDKSVYHIGEGNEQLNMKFINGNKEAVVGIDKFGKPYIVNDPNLMGTYNFIAPGGNSASGFLRNVGHTIVDVLPYYLYGNTRADFYSTFRFTQYNRWKNGLYY